MCVAPLPTDSGRSQGQSKKHGSFHFVPPIFLTAGSCVKGLRPAYIKPMPPRSGTRGWNPRFAKPLALHVGCTQDHKDLRSSPHGEFAASANDWGHDPQKTLKVSKIYHQKRTRALVQLSELCLSMFITNRGPPDYFCLFVRRSGYLSISCEH